MKLQQYLIMKLITYEVDVIEFCTGLDALEFMPDDCIISKLIDEVANGTGLSSLVRELNSLKEYMILPE